MGSAESLDRVAPTRRPNRNPSGSQRWRDLLFLHWAYPLEVVRSLIPPELSLDAWDGRAWVGVVPFIMNEIRPAFWPRLLALDFLETNVRTYVHYRGRPGVYFLSLEASSRLAVTAARWGWHLPYFYAEMSIDHDRSSDAECISYRSVRRSKSAPRHVVRYRPGALLGPSAPGTFEHFLLERYLLFTVFQGTVMEGQVHHEAYSAQQVDVLQVEDELVAAAGLPKVSTPPDVAHFARGVDVEVFGPWRT